MFQKEFLAYDRFRFREAIKSHTDKKSEKKTQ